MTWLKGRWTPRRWLPALHRRLRAFPWPPRPGWRLWAAVAVPVVLAAALIWGDRLAAGYAQDQIAHRIQGYGFPARPAVTVEGFPFLTQLISGRLDGVDISSSRMRLGPVQASVRAHAAGIVLGTGRGSGTISRLTATGLITYPAIAKLAGNAGLPHLAVAADGTREVRLQIGLSLFTVTAFASVTVVPPDSLAVHILSAPQIPAFLLSHVRTITLRLPRLPLGLALTGVSIARHGVLIHVRGANVRFGG
jgi:DUF2993 family protein